MKIEVSYFDIYIKLECPIKESSIFLNSDIKDIVEKTAQKVIDIYMAQKDKGQKTDKA